MRVLEKTGNFWQNMKKSVQSETFVGFKPKGFKAERQAHSSIRNSQPTQ